MGIIDKGSKWVRKSETRFAVTLLALIPLYMALFGLVSVILVDSARNQIALLSIFMSSFFSVLLIGVYVEMADAQSKQTEETSRQADLQEDVLEFQEQQADLQNQVLNLQERQTEIMDQQTELMEAQSAARIQFEGIRKVEHDDIFIQLSNIGESAAENLQLITELEFESERFESGMANLPLHRVVEENENRPTFLEAGERHAMFTAHVPVQLMDTETGHSSLREFWSTMGELYNEGVEQCEVSLYLLGGDLVDEATAQQIWSEEIEIEEEMDFEDAYGQHYI